MCTAVINRLTIASTLVATLVLNSWPASAADLRRNVFSQANIDLLCPFGAKQVDLDALTDLMLLTSGVDKSQVDVSSAAVSSFFDSATAIDGVREDQLKTLRNLLDEMPSWWDEKRNNYGAGYRTEATNCDPEGRPVGSFLSGDSCARIHCIRLDDTRVPRPSGKLDEESRLTFIGDRLRLRSSASELPKAFKNAEAASVAYNNNDEEETTSAEVDVAAGLSFNQSTDDSRLTYIPYLQYGRSKTSVSDGPGTDKEFASTGLLIELFQRVSYFNNWYLTAQPSVTLDLEQKSETFAFKASVEPTFSIESRDFPFILGGYNDTWLGLIAVRPDLKAVFEGGYVFDNGSSPDLKDEQEYFGAGIEPELAIRPIMPFLDRFKFSLSYRYMEITGLELDEVERVDVGATYDLATDGQYTVRLSYVDGENPNTFQDENFWGVTFGVKF